MAKVLDTPRVRKRAIADTSLFDYQASPMRPDTTISLAGPVKRSITIAGHATSISLEPVFWIALERAAASRAVPLSALVADIDALRIAATDPPNLASALRSWLFVTSCDCSENCSH